MSTLSLGRPGCRSSRAEGWGVGMTASSKPRLGETQWFPFATFTKMSISIIANLREKPIQEKEQLKIILFTGPNGLLSLCNRQFPRAVGGTVSG